MRRALEPSGWILIPSPSLKAMAFASVNDGPPSVSRSVFREEPETSSTPSPPLPRSSAPSSSVPIVLPKNSESLSASANTPPRALPPTRFPSKSASWVRSLAVSSIEIPHPWFGTTNEPLASVPKRLRCTVRSLVSPTIPRPEPRLPEMMFRPASVPSPIAQSWIPPVHKVVSSRTPSPPLGMATVPVMSVPMRLPTIAPLLELPPDAST